MSNSTGTIHRRKSKGSRFIYNSVKNYLCHSTPKELVFDLLLPAFLSLVLISIISLLIPNARDYLKTLQEVNSIVINIIAILAGFNTASLSILAATSKDIFSTRTKGENSDEIPITKGSFYHRFKNLIFNNPSGKELDAIVAFFSYAVISQLLILIMCLLINVILIAFLKVETPVTIVGKEVKYIFLTITSFFWLTLVIHSIFLSIRNIDMISHFIKYSSNPTSK